MIISSQPLRYGEVDNVLTNVFHNSKISEVKFVNKLELHDTYEVEMASLQWGLSDLNHHLN